MSKKIVFPLFCSMILIIIGVGIINIRLNRQLYIDVLEATDDEEIEKVENDQWDLDYMQDTLDDVKNVNFTLKEILDANINGSSYKYTNENGLVNLTTEPKFKVFYCREPFEIRLDFPDKTIIFSKEIFVETFNNAKNIISK